MTWPKASDPKWRSISNAPKNGKLLILGLERESGFYCALGSWDTEWDVEKWWGQQPTHWMPYLAPERVSVIEPEEKSA
jgi:hypothetical protein